MNNILLCSNNPLLVKSLYGILRDEDCNVSVADHPSLAVRMVFRSLYSALIIDSEPFGLSVDDAIKIIKVIQPDIVVIFVGFDTIESDALTIEAPIDLEEFRAVIQNINRCIKIQPRRRRGNGVDTQRNYTKGL